MPKFYIFDIESREGLYSVTADSEDAAYRKWARTYKPHWAPLKDIDQEVEVLKKETAITTVIIDLDPAYAKALEKSLY